MLLRRVKHHVVNENWFAVCVDFIIVVVGVYVGIEVSNWNETRQQDERAQEYLERIRADLEYDKLTIGNRLRFWSQVISYGEAAIRHAESGVLHEGSRQKTVLAYFQASQVSPYASVKVTYDEMKAAGDLRLIPNNELRVALAEYHVNATSLQAQHLFEYVPTYRESIRGIMPMAMHGYVWGNCHTSERNAQRLVDCDLPVDDAVAAELLSVASSDREVVRGLRFWITNLQVARNALTENLGKVEELIELVESSSGRN